MSKALLQDIGENINDNNRGASFSDITDRIIKDLEDAKDDISKKVDYAKDLIAATLKFYKNKSLGKVNSVGIENDIESLRSEAKSHLRRYWSSKNEKTDTADDESMVEEEEYSILRKDPSFSRLIDKVETELLKINDNTKVLAESTKSAIRNYLNTSLPQSKDNDVKATEKPINENLNSLENFSEKPEMHLEKTELILKESNGFSTHKSKGTDEGSHPEKFVKGCLLDCKTKFKSDFKTKRADVDRIVKDVKKKVEKLRSLNGSRKF